MISNGRIAPTVGSDDAVIAKMLRADGTVGFRRHAVDWWLCINMIGLEYVVIANQA